MSLDGEPIGTSHVSGFQKLYDSPTCSDVTINFPSGGIIRAHRAILAAGSGYFNRKLQEPEYMRDSGVTFRVGQEDGIAATTNAIKYMYGIEFPGTPDRERSLHALSCVGAFAETFEVAGLSGTVIAYAHRELAECLSDDDKLKGFLGVAAVWTQASTTRSGCLAFAVRILGQNLAAIRTKAVFQKLLGEVPKLAIALLNLVAEEKSELEGKQQKIEDSE